MPNKKVNLSLTHLKPFNQTKTPLLCNECERTFQRVIPKNAIEIVCPYCGGFDTETI